MSQLILENLSGIETLPARVAVINPAAAERALEQGKRVATSNGDHVALQFAPVLIDLFAKHRPDLLQSLLNPPRQPPRGFSTTSSKLVERRRAVRCHPSPPFA